MGPAPAEKPLSYDKLIKAFVKRYYAELGEWLLGERPESVEEDETTYALASARGEDKHLCLRFKDKPGMFLHLELQLRGDVTMPQRITEYVGFSLEAILRALERGLSPAVLVVYLDREHYREDPGRFDLVGALSFQVHTTYKVVKLWEHSPEPILEMESPGLCPFLPLMRGQPEDLVIRSLQKIRNAPEEVASAEEKRDLLLALRAMARRVIKDMSVIEAILSDPELLEGDPFYQKGQKEGREEGRVEGLHEGEEHALREAIVDFLAARFGEVPPDVRTRLAAIHCREELKGLVTAAARAADVEGFRGALPGVAG